MFKKIAISIWQRRQSARHRSALVSLQVGGEEVKSNICNEQLDVPTEIIVSKGLTHFKASAALTSKGACQNTLTCLSEFGSILER